MKNIQKVILPQKVILLSCILWGAVCLKTTKLDCLVNIDDVY